MDSTKKKTYDLLYETPYLIGHWVGFRDLTPLHNKWLRSFLYREEDYTLLAHRGSYKTTTLSIFLALFVVMYPKKNLLFFRKTDTDVAEVISQTGKILETGVLRRISKTLYGVDLTVTRCTASVIDTNLNTTTKGQPQIMGLGLGASITGKHADIVVTDDIVNLADRESAAERKRTIARYMELENIKNPGGRFINTGTPWHKEDAISRMPNVERFDCYSTGLLSGEDIEYLRSRMTPSLFAANYELKHIADGDAMFSAPQFTDDVESIYDGIGHIDASYGGADSTAYTIVKDTGENLVVYGRKFDKHVEECLPSIMRLHREYRAGTMFCETNADKGYLATSIESLGGYPQTYHESMNKYIKISTYLKANWPRVRFLSGTDPEYIQQILDYTEFSAHDDCPDSLASAIRAIQDDVDIQLLPGGLI